MPAAVLGSLRPFVIRCASLTSLGVVLACGWFATIELLLRHDGYIWRALVAAAIVAEGALTFAVFEDLIDLGSLHWPRGPSRPGSAVRGSSPRTWRGQASRRDPISKATCCSSAWR